MSFYQNPIKYCNMAIYCNTLKHNTQYSIDLYCFTPSVSTVGPSGACAPLTFSLLNVILNNHIAYLFCSCYKCMHSLEVVATLCSDESLFHAGYLLLAV